MKDLDLIAEYKRLYPNEYQVNADLFLQGMTPGLAPIIGGTFVKLSQMGILTHKLNVLLLYALRNPDTFPLARYLATVEKVDNELFAGHPSKEFIEAALETLSS